jgi:hypothetical protein
MKPTVIENFLVKEDFQILKENVFSKYFPWYFNHRSVLEIDSQYQFTHIFYNEDVKNNFFSLVQKAVDKLDPISLLRVKANLNPQTNKIVETGEHQDMYDDRFTSAVLFLNNCNGYCRIGDTKFFSEENKLIMFNSNTKHTGSTCTDVSRRVLINFVFLK